MTEPQLEFSPLVARALDGYPPTIERSADWQDVLRRAGVTHARARRRWFALAAGAAVFVTLSLATPLGGALRDRVADFSAWLRGQPGEPVSSEEQRAFEEQNARSYAAFPGSPQLRRLTKTEIDGVTYDLLGFRSAGSLCIRLVATGEASGSTTACAPVDDLQNDDAPVRVLLADWPVGKGEKTATVGFETYRAPRARVTAGIAADEVESVELVDDNGGHRVGVVANAFLHVAERPDVDQWVTHVRARLAGGGTVGVPFTPALRGMGGIGGAPGEPGGPTRVERDVDGGRIGWLDRREERGEPLPDDVHIVGEPEFGRVITPDPGSSKRIAITISTLDIGPHKGTRSVCYTVITRGGSGGGCAGAPGGLFKDVPFTFGYTVMGAGDQYATFEGIASDDVARLELYTATGNRIDVPLRDNAFLAEVALARFPAKMVAYDAQGRVIGIRQTPRDEGPQTPIGEPILRLSETANGSSLELVAYRTKEGGRCWFGRGTGKARVNMGGCVGKEWREAPLRIGFIPEPPLFLYGQVRDEIKRITVRYADGEELKIEPERYGYVLVTIPPERREEGSRVVEFIGYDAQGRVVARERLPAMSR
jgi:hypothetical protein